MAFDDVLAVQALQKLEYFHATCSERMDPDLVLELVGHVSFDLVLGDRCVVTDDDVMRFRDAASQAGGRFRHFKAKRRGDYAHVFEFEHPAKPRAPHVDSFPFTPSSNTLRSVYEQ